MAEMEERVLASLIKQKVANSIGMSGDAISGERRKAAKYYRGDKFGTEEEGRSQVVSRDVAEAIDGLMPSMIEIFASGDEVVNFEPRGPEDEEGCKQATDYINHIIDQNDRLKLFYVWIKDALMQKVGTVKAWFDESEEITKEKYHGLTQAEYDILKADPDIEITEEEAIESQGVAAQAFQMPQLAEPTYNVSVTKTNKRGRVRIKPLPPEEFLIEKGAVDIDDSLFCAHRYEETISNLIQQGHPRAKLERVGSEDAELTGEKAERFSDEGWTSGTNDTATPDRATDKVWVTEAYLRVDYNDDGIAELRKVTCVGDSEYSVLDNEEVDYYPFASITPIIVPHKFYGQSIADQTMDIQERKSAIQRNILDSFYLHVQPRLVVQGEVNYDDLLSVRLGQPIRAGLNAKVTPVETRFAGQEALTLLEYEDGVREQRTGITRYNQGLDADSLNKTATGINIIATAGQQRQQLIARVIAETGVKRLFKLVLKLVCQHQQKPEMIRLRNTWVPMDPREWDSKWDVSVTVGLGSGNKDQQLQRMLALLDRDATIIEMQGGLNGPIVTAENVYNKLKKVCEASSLKNTELYYTDPKTLPPQPPKEDPKVALEKQKLQLDAQRTQSDAQLAQWKAQQDSQLARDKAVADFQLQVAKMEMELGLRQGELSANIQMKRDDQQFQQDMKQKDQRHAQRMDRSKQTVAEITASQEEDEKASVVHDIQEETAAASQAAQQAVQLAAQAVQQLAEIERRLSAPKTIKQIRKNGKLVGAEVEQGGQVTTVTLQ